MERAFSGMSERRVSEIMRETRSFAGSNVQPAGSFYCRNCALISTHCFTHNVLG